MKQILITAPCLVTFGDDRGGQHADEFEIVDVPNDVASTLVGVGRGLYVSRDDDPTRGKVSTATKDQLEAAARVRDARAKAAG